MLTPKFDVTQTERHIIITLHVPFIKISESEMYIEGTEFKFYLKPYYLRLNFSGSLVEDGTEHAKYNVDNGDVIIHVPKRVPGEHFEDLGMLSKLLAPKKEGRRNPKIQVLEGGGEVEVEEDEEDLDEDFSWEWDQEYPQVRRKFRVPTS